MSYLPRVKIVGTRIGTQGGSLQEIQIMGWEDEKGRPFEPTPYPKPSAQLEVATPTETAGSTTLGSTLTGTPATFTGGEPPVVVKTRWERSVDDTPASWAPLSDYVVDGPTTYTTVEADNDRYLRFTTQATDNEQFVTGSFGNSIGPMTTTTTIGVISLAPPNTTADAGATIIFDVLISGDATPTYTWSIRSGPGNFTSAATGPQVEVQVNPGATSGSTIQVQVTATDITASDSGKGTIATIIVN